MLHMLLYILHVTGMAVLLSLALILVFKNDITAEVRKKLSLYLMSAAHTQLLTGFALFFLLLSEVNHMKIGIKMLLAIDVAVFATLFRRSVSNDATPNRVFLIILLVSSIITTFVAFVM
jgi:hypothetical protein